MARPELTALELLVAVAEHGSMSAAARTLGIAQPNASRSLARLERHLDLTLVVRDRVGSTLTPDGLLVAEWARDVVAAADVLTDGATVLADQGSAPLRVSASQTVAEHLLPAWLAELRRSGAGAGVRVAVANTAEVIDHLRRGRCDLGFVEGPGVPRGLRHQVVAHDELLLVVPPDHRWARRRRPVDTAELLVTELVSREPGSGTRTTLTAALGRPPLVGLELSSNAAVRVAVAAGSGPAVLSRLAVTEALRSRTLVEVALVGVDLRRQLRAVWRGPARPTAAAARLVQLARTLGSRGRPPAGRR